MIVKRRYVIVGHADQWRIWDIRRNIYIGKFGEPDHEYVAVSSDVATMRARDFSGRLDA